MTNNHNFYMFDIKLLYELYNFHNFYMFNLKLLYESYNFHNFYIFNLELLLYKSYYIIKIFSNVIVKPKLYININTLIFYLNDKKKKWWEKSI